MRSSKGCVMIITLWSRSVRDGSLCLEEQAPF